MKKKNINVIMVVAVIAVAFFNVNKVPTKGHPIFNLKSIVHSAMANGESGDDMCTTYGDNYYSEYNGCYFHDHVEWCEGDIGPCFYEQFQYRKCPPGDWELICYEAGAHDC